MSRPTAEDIIPLYEKHGVEHVQDTLIAWPAGTTRCCALGVVMLDVYDGDRREVKEIAERAGDGFELAAVRALRGRFPGIDDVFVVGLIAGNDGEINQEFYDEDERYRAGVDAGVAVTEYFRTREETTNAANG